MTEWNQATLEYMKDKCNKILSSSRMPCAIPPHEGDKHYDYFGGVSSERDDAE